MNKKSIKNDNSNNNIKNICNNKRQNSIRCIYSKKAANRRDANAAQVMYSAFLSYAHIKRYFCFLRLLIHTAYTVLKKSYALVYLIGT